MQLMQPEMLKSQAKYANRKDQRSQQMMQQEMMELYKKYGEAIEADCSDEEFMALFEKFPDFDRYDDAFVEGEEEFTSCVAHYVDEHIENFATIVE